MLFLTIGKTDVYKRQTINGWFSLPPPSQKGELIGDVLFEFERLNSHETLKKITKIRVLQKEGSFYLTFKLRKKRSKCFSGVVINVSPEDAGDLVSVTVFYYEVLPVYKDLLNLGKRLMGS